MSDDENKSGGGWASVVGGAAGLGAGVPLASRAVKGGILNKWLTPEFFTALHANGGDVALAAKAAGIPEDKVEEVTKLFGHDSVKEPHAAANAAFATHSAHVESAVEAIRTDATKVVFSEAENGVHTAHITLKDGKVVELKGVKLPDGVKPGEEVVGEQLHALRQTMTSSSALGHLGFTGVEPAHVSKVTIEKVGNGYRTKVHLSEAGKAAHTGEHVVEGVITKEHPHLPAGVTLAEGTTTLEIGGEEAGKLATVTHGWLKQASKDAALLGAEVFQPVKALMSKAAGFGFAFKNAGMAGKAGIVAAGAAGAYAGAKIIGGMFGGHAEKVEAAPAAEAAPAR